MKRKTTRRKPRRMFRYVCAVFLSAGICFTAAYCLGAARSLVAPPPPTFERHTPAATDPGNRVIEHDMQGPMSAVRIEELALADTRHLALVNRDYAIGGEPDSATLVSAWPTVAVKTREITLLEPTREAVKFLFDAARRDGIDTLFVSSGYRGYDEQRQLYDDAPDKSYAQPPDHSEHQLGLAADILAKGISQSAMAASREGQWLAGHSWQHGLILRYAADKQDITGIADEPWHFRYVGQPHAWYCWQHGLCFEEYIQFLKDSGGYSARYDGSAYSVVYRSPQDGVVYLPEGWDYSVSSDNTGGYIMTAVWE